MPFLGSLKDKCGKSSSVCFLNKENKQLLQFYLTYQSNQWKMNTSTKLSNISISEKAKNRGLKHIKFLFSEA